jgi:hypothetical protein
MMLDLALSVVWTMTKEECIMIRFQLMEYRNGINANPVKIYERLILGGTIGIGEEMIREDVFPTLGELHSSFGMWFCPKNNLFYMISHEVL